MKRRLVIIGIGSSVMMRPLRAVAQTVTITVVTGQSPPKKAS